MSKNNSGSEAKAAAPAAEEAAKVAVTQAPPTLSSQDLMYIIGVIRRVVPKDFDDGKELTYCEAKLLQVIQASQQLAPAAGGAPGMPPMVPARPAAG